MTVHIFTLWVNEYNLWSDWIGRQHLLLGKLMLSSDPIAASLMIVDLNSTIKIVWDGALSSGGFEID